MSRGLGDVYKRQVLFKGIREHVLERNPMNVISVEKSLHILVISRHMKRHTGEKPNGCNQCDKAFSLHNYLQMHKTTHSGEKPYACNQFGKAWSDEIWPSEV